jgi:hypothetical protein
MIEILTLASTQGKLESISKHLSADNVYSSSEPFPDVEGAVTVIGVEATSYLQQIIDEPPSHEPLLAALGGDPIGLKQHLETELNRWKDNRMRPLFVFDGLNVVGKDEITLEAAKFALEKTSHAWNLYGDNHPEDAVKAFGASGMVLLFYSEVSYLISSRRSQSS